MNIFLLTYLSDAFWQPLWLFQFNWHFRPFFTLCPYLECCIFSECLLGMLYSVYNVLTVIFSKTFYIHSSFFFFFTKYYSSMDCLEWTHFFLNLLLKYRKLVSRILILTCNTLLIAHFVCHGFPLLSSLIRLSEVLTVPSLVLALIILMWILPLFAFWTIREHVKVVLEQKPSLLLLTLACKLTDHLLLFLLMLCCWHLHANIFSPHIMNNFT